MSELSAGPGVAVGPPAPVVGVSDPDPVAVVEADAEGLGVVVEVALEPPQPVVTSKISVISVSATYGRARDFLDIASLQSDVERAAALNLLPPRPTSSGFFRRPASGYCVAASVP